MSRPSTTQAATRRPWPPRLLVLANRRPAEDQGLQDLLRALTTGIRRPAVGTITALAQLCGVNPPEPDAGPIAQDDRVTVDHTGDRAAEDLTSKGRGCHQDSG